LRCLLDAQFLTWRMVLGTLRHIVKTPNSLRGQYGPVCVVSKGCCMLKLGRSMYVQGLTQSMNALVVDMIALICLYDFCSMWYACASVVDP